MKYSRIIFAAMLGVSAKAQLATWDVNGITSSATNPYSGVTGTNISSASLTLGSGLGTSAAANTFGGSNFNTTSFATAISGNDYLSFTVTPSSGYQMSISSIAVNIAAGASVTGGNMNFALLTSVTGYTTSDQLWSFSTASSTPSQQSITLSAVSGLQNVASSIEFRIYGWFDSGATGTTIGRIRNLSGNDLVISGSTVAVPEPSTYAVIVGAVALLGVMIRRRIAGRIAA